MKNILLAYNGSDSSNAALRMAIMLHKQYNTHVTALFAHGQSAAGKSLQPWMSDSIKATLNDIESLAYNTVKTQFFAATENVIADDKCHWIAVEGAADLTVAEYAGLYDMTLVGRYDTLSGAEHLALHPQDIILRGNCPIVMVPKDWQTRPINQHAIIVWDDNSSTGSILSAALHIIQTTRQITVLRVDDGRKKPTRHLPSIETILARHDIQVTSHTLRTARRHAGQTVVDFCNQSDADLLILGALKHSYLRETLFSGWTQASIRDIELPVLMSQ